MTQSLPSGVLVALLKSIPPVGISFSSCLASLGELEEKLGICFGARGEKEVSANDDDDDVGGVSDEAEANVVTGGELLGTVNDEEEDDGVNDDDEELENDEVEGDDNLSGAAGDPIIIGLYTE